MNALRLTRAALIGVAASCAAGATACSDTSPPAPAETRAASPAVVHGTPDRKVVLRAVPGPNGSVQQETTVVHLRPVMKGEPSPWVHD